MQLWFPKFESVRSGVGNKLQDRGKSPQPMSPCMRPLPGSAPTHGRGLGLWKSGFPIKDGLLPACNAGAKGDTGLIPGLGRSPGGRHGNPLQCSYLDNPMDRGAWQATAHGVERVCHD